MKVQVIHTANSRTACALCLRVMPLAALTSKTMVDLAGRPVTRHYCADALACIAATRDLARTS